MDNFKKVTRVGSGKWGNVFLNIEFTDGKLSITGVEGPQRSGNAKGSAGQIIMSDWDLTEYAPGYDAAKVEAVRNLWKCWHLNDMQAGSPAQTAYLEDNPVDVSYPASRYEVASKALEAAGLNPDPGYLHNGKPYRYGSAWLKVEVPLDVLEFFAALPDADITPAWV